MLSLCKKLAGSLYNPTNSLILADITVSLKAKSYPYNPHQNR
jgi:hypothetical protein